MVEHQVHESRFWGYLMIPLYPWVPWRRWSIFEPELALLVGLQVLSIKGREREGDLFDKILLALPKSPSWP